VFSALGLLFADIELNESRACLRRLDALAQEEAGRIYDQLAAVIAGRLGRKGEQIAFQRLADLRYVGQAFEITVAVPEGKFDAMARKDLGRRFDVEHETRYGHCFAGQYSHEVVNLRLVGSIAPDGARRIASVDAPPTVAEGEREVYFGPQYGLVSTSVLSRSGLNAEARAGPMVIEEYEGTVVVPPGATARRDRDGNILIDLEVGD
jgi:N-methylhydantoinase A